MDPRRLVPRTDVLLADPRIAALADRFHGDVVKAVVSDVQQLVRDGRLPPEQAVDAVVASLPANGTSLRPALNATGVVVHTNLGRAPLAPMAMAALHAASGAVDVEYDLASGRRSRRGRATLAALRRRVPEAADVHVVNNGAAAVLLAVTVLAAGREVIVSRGELVEIGDGFRLPDLLVTTGARLVEVGTTNRTTAADYARAIGPDTGCILKVHPSNFRVSGFTSAVDISEVAALRVPVVADLGSGLLRPDPLLPDEPDATTALQAGAAVVTASADKLLGGPQGGLLLGGRGHGALIDRCRRHPLARALRVDKLTLAALEATLLCATTPVAAALHAEPDDLLRRVEQLQALVSAGEVVPSAGVVGGGGAPGVELTGWALALPEACAAALRSGEPPVVCRIDRGRCLVDPRSLPPDQDASLAQAIVRALSQQANGPGTHRAAHA